jgi:hypothetical protein
MLHNNKQTVKQKKMSTNSLLELLIYSAGHEANCKAQTSRQQLPLTEFFFRNLTGIGALLMQLSKGLFQALA